MVSEGGLTPLEERIEHLYTDWGLGLYRDPIEAERTWDKLNDAVNLWCHEHGYSPTEGWEEVRRRLDLRLK